VDEAEESGAPLGEEGDFDLADVGGGEAAGEGEGAPKIVRRVLILFGRFFLPPPLPDLLFFSSVVLGAAFKCAAATDAACGPNTDSNNAKSSLSATCPPRFKVAGGGAPAT